MDTTKRNSGSKNPQESANFISLLFFGWIAPIFWKGARHGLEMEDIYDPLKSDESQCLADHLEREWKKELKKVERASELKKHGKSPKIVRPSLTWAIARIFWSPLLTQGLLLFIQSTGLRLMQPILQGWVIAYFNPTQDTTTKGEALFYAGMLVLTTFVGAFIIRHCTLSTQRIGMCVRVACCSLIYRKVLRLDQTKVNNSAAGQVANLISNDVARFDNLFVYFHYIWIMPIEVMLIGYVMWQSVGAAALVATGAMILQTIFLQGYLSKLSARLRSQIAVKTDERVQLMSEFISGIQVVKLYSWEKAFERMVSKIRGLEMKLIGYASYLRAVHQGVGISSGKFTLYLTLITYVLAGNTLSPDKTFALSTLLHLLRHICALGYSQAIIAVNEATKSLKRITDFLLLDEIERTDDLIPTLCNATKEGMHPQFKDGVAIETVNVAVNWARGQLPPTLYGISIKVPQKSLCAVVGPIASGKSSLLHLLLDELPVGSGRLSLLTGENGKTEVNRRDIRISYCSQEPWLFSASIRDNILFGLPYDVNRYHQVTEVCALLEDFEQFPQGDLSYVGERGAALSGGQKARVNLARAVYRDAELYLFDDPLSAVDTHVGRHLFDACISGYLKDKTRILVTHQLQYLPQADTVIVLNRGTVEYQGTYDELVKKNFDILVHGESEDPEEIECRVEDHKKKPEGEVTSTVTADEDDGDWCSELSREDSAENTDVKVEGTGKDELPGNLYFKYFSAGGNACSLIFLAVVFVSAQLATSGSDYWLTIWTNQETTRTMIHLNRSPFFNGNESDRQASDSQWFDEFGLVSSLLAICVYTLCIIASVLLIILRNILFMKTFMKASRKIHTSMFNNLLLGTMRFFNINPAGRILNRFSKDLGTMDEQLPGSIMQMLQTCSIVIGVVVTIGLVDHLMIAASAVMFIIIHVVRIYYVKITQNVKRLEGIAKSPVFSHVSATLDGLTTIRSRGPQAANLLQKEFDRHQDAHTGAWYLIIATTNTFGFIFQLISSAYVTCVCYSVLLIDDVNMLGGSVGLAISQSLLLTGLIQLGIRQSADVITQMTAVERVLQYTDLPKEGPFTSDKPPPPSWPSRGSVVMKDVVMRYAENKPSVLKGLNLNITHGWKVGIVGRTGAGKSSLVSALFRLTGDGLNGEIVIDGIDTQTIGLSELRPCVSIIPQEPVLFSATLRYNLDPFEEYSDVELWDSLQEVELGDAVTSLDFRVVAGGANFSVGQRQLVCLARAILRNNKLLVLDEATANVDQQTDALIQNTIRRRFADRTVLTIAHRLNTIMDYDRVLVMAGGRIVEFGHPHVLLNNPDGPFSKMLQRTGKAMAENLAKIAEAAYLSNPEFRKERDHETVTDGNEQILIRDGVKTDISH